MRLIALWTGLLPFVLASLIAVGVMPARAANGAVMLVICTGHGVAEIAFDPLTMKPLPGGDKAPGPDDCPWAACQPTLAPGTATPVVQPAGGAGRMAPVLGHTVLAVARATGLPPATGPPSAV